MHGVSIKRSKIMNIFDKLRIIRSDAVPKENARIETLGTSVKITHTCGCVLVEHFACGEPTTVRQDEAPDMYERLLAERKYYVELCSTHKPEGMAEIIKTDGTRQPVQPVNGSNFTLEEMQTIVGGYIELVELDGNTTMVVNEEGKLEDLPLNLKATGVFRSHYPDSDDFIVGDVLVGNNNQIR